MKRKMTYFIAIIVSSSVMANNFFQNGLSSCRFSSKDAAMNFSKAISGSSLAATKLKKEDLAQVQECSTAMAIELSKNISHEHLSKMVNTSYRHFENGLEVSVELNNRDFYKIEMNTLKGEASSIEGDYRIYINYNGAYNQVSEVIPLISFNNDMQMEVMKNNFIRFSSKVFDMNTQVQAKIKRSNTLDIKSIEVSSDELLTAITPLLEFRANELIERFNISQRNYLDSVEYEVSDLKCDKVSKNTLSCSSSFHYKFLFKNSRK